MKHLDDISALVRTLRQNSTFHALLIQSPPGWAKSSTIENVLKELNVNFVSLGAYTTPLSLFNALAKAPSSLFVLDDSAGLYDDPIAMSILKAATWSSAGNGGIRQVNWSSTSERVLTPSFVFSGKLILLTNTLPGGKETEAFLSRTFFLSIRFYRDQVAEMLLEAAKSPIFFDDAALAWRVALFLCGRLSSYDFSKINLRTLHMGYEIAKSNPENWKELFERLLPSAMPREVVAQLSDLKWPVEAQVREFTRLTGLERRMFFNYRKEGFDGLNIGEMKEIADVP